ncbi:hypothetical protein Lepto7375DRAFT_7298 [Leptolyngbya sp. PCC 7375]|nr:hypothetical protein Lepto7375DRAFT_7298 [Leptolyngbya sp. PCC 7375]
MRYQVLGNGSIVYLVNCSVSKTELTAGFAFFEGRCPDSVPIKDTANKRIGVFELPDEAKGSAHPVTLGDFDSPIIMKRVP